MSATPVKPRVLIVEDDAPVRELLAFHLQRADFCTLEAATVEAADDLVLQADVVLLDWMLPDGSGLEWLQTLRRHDPELPVLMLTARAAEPDKVEGLGAGADDYLTKPYSVAELVARLRALLRRSAPKQAHIVGPLSVSTETGQAELAGRALDLTRREFDLLAYLSANPGRIFARAELLDRVWGTDFIGTERTVDQHIAQLRHLIGAELIETVRGRGYRLVDPNL